MDNRLYFVLGDLLANITLGALIGALAVMLVGTGWNMWLAMVLMMVLGMVLSFFGAFGFGICFGAMEVIVPGMLTGMISGMVVGMWHAMTPMSVTHGIVIGGITGLMVLTIVWIASASLRGVTIPQENK